MVVVRGREERGPASEIERADEAYRREPLHGSSTATISLQGTAQSIKRTRSAQKGTSESSR